MKLSYSIPHKIVTLLIAGASISAVIMMVTLNLLRPAERIIYLVTLLPLVLPLGYVFFWQRSEKQQPERSPRILAFWRGVISYCLAFDIVSFGWKKVFGLQFRPVPLSIADIPTGEQVPSWLMWHFYGYSHTFGMIVASAQIIGSFLLLFRRTRLLGIMVLLPVMINIVCINYFYRLGIGPLYQSLVLSLGLMYLLLSEYHRLVLFFLSAQESLPTIHLGGSKLKNAIRLCVMVLAFGYIYLFYWRSQAAHESELYGVYDVKSLQINHQPTSLKVLAQDSILNRVYFDDGNACILQFNSHKRRLFGHYDYDSQRKTFKSIFNFASDPVGDYMPRGKTDTLQAIITRFDSGKEISIAGYMGRDSLQLVLQKVR
ncbi:hypothetical protein AHMF7605_08610 [Adhaeribacter arboris]|uniref:DoxX family protein n=1 Tax=Adhaeribacter arboris TaxID=2072846 RepID=A0A2T2YDL4_9BACT|nr:hypothetical protein [Adhaeribacter arboris]PSR53583.1 hypothetical protein AHMF7605_08610 [Adhaeribacter arboris]